jgi:hypothetical protein
VYGGRVGAHCKEGGRAGRPAVGHRHHKSAREGTASHGVRGCPERRHGLGDLLDVREHFGAERPELGPVPKVLEMLERGQLDGVLYEVVRRPFGRGDRRDRRLHLPVGQGAARRRLARAVGPHPQHAPLQGRLHRSVAAPEPRQRPRLLRARLFGLRGFHLASRNLARLLNCLAAVNHNRSRTRARPIVRSQIVYYVLYSIPEERAQHVVQCRGRKWRAV